MPVSNRLKNQHLLWRAAFGPMTENIADLDNISQKNLWHTLLKTSADKPQAINVASNLFDGAVKNIEDLSQFSKLTQDQKKQLQVQSREDIKNLNLRWMYEMINSQAQFREKMSFFWNGHFACRIINIFYQQQLLDIVRNNAFGNFGDLLRQVSKSPAMLQFLNNQQNKKQHPNENFAREVMELFTLGRGNYAETDVKEGARAFTGWTYNLQGEFVFKDNQHDDGVKTFLGKTGNFNGDDIITILLEQKQTAIFITKKIYRFFVNDDVDDEKVNLLADRFYQSNYDIKKLMEDIFTSNWFYDEKSIGTKIKSPVELLVGIRRLLPMELANDDSQLLFQRLLGQVLFYPPNVAGWPGGKNWIDSSTLMLRLRLPQIITDNDVVNIVPKTDDDVMMGQMMEERITQMQNNSYAAKGATAIVNWNAVTDAFKNVKREYLLPQISSEVLQTQSRVSDNLLGKYIDNQSREEYIKTLIVNLMSTPEYQLC
ncbi:MAG TPA: DUF1800 domain-containing protein [Ferruginibacter sp.]|nr:DUF1800 domain-containing protein [Ferruginibacter sp.]